MTIFITVKGKSKRCPNKNLILLPYVLNNFSNYLKEIIVITDSIELKKLAEDYGVREIFLEDERVQLSEFNSIYNYLSKNNKFSEIPEFIYLPVTQPFSSEELLKNISSLDLSDYDFSTTYSIIPDRKIFLLNNLYVLWIFYRHFVLYSDIYHYQSHFSPKSTRFSTK